MYVHFAVQYVMHHTGKAAHQFRIFCLDDAESKHFGILKQITVILDHVKTEFFHIQCAFCQFFYERLFQILSLLEGKNLIISISSCIASLRWY